MDTIIDAFRDPALMGLIAAIAVVVFLVQGPNIILAFCKAFGKSSKGGDADDPLKMKEFYDPLDKANKTE